MDHDLQIFVFFLCYHPEALMTQVMSRLLAYYFSDTIKLTAYYVHYELHTM